ncbi:MAG TPA: co-chaperone DjlA [Gammaproteobacteria bacterium]
MTRWFGKAIGGVLGFAAAGPLGSLLGVLLGHQLDQSASRRVAGSGGFEGAPAEISRLFFAVAFETMGHVAKADGRVSEEEIREARRIMHAMELSPEQVRAAIDHFTRGKDPRYPLSERLALLAAKLGDRHDLARAFVEIQMQAALGVGEVTSEKRRMLWQIASALGVGRVELAQMEALLRAERLRASLKPDAEREIEAAYGVLGVAPSAPDEEVKKAYRRLMSQHHPDKLVARGLPPTMAGVAAQKTHEIRAAYERIKAARGLR